jgi:hypothetical protein
MNGLPSLKHSPKSQLLSLLLIYFLVCAVVILRPSPAAAQTGTGPTITFSDPSPLIEPGKKITVQAFVKDQSGVQIANVRVEWRIADDKLKDYVGLGEPLNLPTKNEMTFYGLSADAKPGTPKPEVVPVIVKSGDIENVLMLRYQAKADPPNKVVFDEKPNVPTVVAPGGKTILSVKVIDPSGNRIPGAKVEWKIPDEMKEFVELGTPVNDKENNTIPIVGLFSSKTAKPFSIPVIATSGGTSILINVRYQAVLEPQVDVTWDVLPQGIVGDNFGRTIRKDYYCIEVAIGNNTGNDLQLTGLGFDLKGTHRVPNSSYAIVRGSLDRRKLTHPRTLTMAGISAFGSLLTGFNPFFHNINHAKNFSQGIDIISNPLAKGLDSVWKDPVPDEINRLDQQTMRDDKIIPNNSTFKTRIFFPKDALFKNGEPGRDDVRAVRERLGQMILVGYAIKRENFINRVRQGSAAAAPTP